MVSDRSSNLLWFLAGLAVGGAAGLLLAPVPGATAEIEVLAMKSVLDDAGVDSVIIGDSALPNLSFQLRVAQADVEQARSVLAEAEAAGPAAAAEAERESELKPGPTA